MFFAPLVLWGLLGLSVPLIIALWNRRRRRTEYFGGFALLRKLAQTTQRRWRLVEIIKLLNRLVLLTLIVMALADPQKKHAINSSAESGFVILIDGGRIMQMKTALGESLVKLQQERLRSILESIPTQAQGALFMVSDRCEPISIESQRILARSDAWIRELSRMEWPYANAPTTSQGLEECLAKARSLFGSREIYSVFVSPLPNTLSAETLKNISIEALEPPKFYEPSELKIQQEVRAERVRVTLSPAADRRASLISSHSVETLGVVRDLIDLVPAERNWLWIQGSQDSDFWGDESIVSLSYQPNAPLTVWAAKETPGYLSLLSALRKNSRVSVNRQIGGEPQGSLIIIYGPVSQIPEHASHVWLFLNSEGASSYGVRDRKIWAPGISSDVQKAFRIASPDGAILIKRYSLLELDRFEILESFEDGAPSLMKDRIASGKVWVSPFDLEDLTTDLTLEPTFIPYLYRHIDTWLSQAQQTDEEHLLQPLWTMPGATKPAASILRSYRWPGVYGGSDAGTKLIEPIAPPTAALSAPAKLVAASMEETWISLRARLYPWLLGSIALELALCLWGASRLILLMLVAFSAPAYSETRLIPVQFFSETNADRVRAMDEFSVEASRLSNLDLDKPKPFSWDRLGEAPIVVLAGSSWTPLSSSQREKIRDYCERGGLLFFDDSLATAESSFYQRVRDELSLIFPGRSLKPVPKEDVVFRTYYLLDEVSGRKLASPYLEGIELDGRWVAFVSSNDLLGAVLTTASGDYAFAVTPYGMSQRVLAKRLLLNIFMYSVTLNYKDDAIHLPHILKRRQR